MISVVCVYNNERTLKNVLLKSLNNQSAEFELITLDNTDHRYKSASEALNYGGAKAKGDYIMFIHQDMWLVSDSLLEAVEEMLKTIPDLGIAGVAGTSEKGNTLIDRRKWTFNVFNQDWWLQGNKPVHKPEEVQTLDECLLIVPSWVFARLQFDEQVFDGWDCYGVDYCLSVRQLGLKAYTIPAPCIHSCLREIYYVWEFNELLKYHKKLYTKHRRNYKRIYSWMAEISWPSLKFREFMQLVAPIYLRLFVPLNMILKREISGCDSVLDLGCGYFSPIYRTKTPFSVGVELFDPYLQESKRKDIHSQYIKADVRNLEFKPKSFDAVVAIDILEHLTKQEGTDLLTRMEKWARKKIVVFTTNGFIHQDIYDNNPLQEHRSCWSVREFSEIGYKVRGFGGWKRIKYPKASVKHRTVFLCGRISDLTQKITYYYPKLAVQLIAVKKIDHGD